MRLRPFHENSGVHGTAWLIECHYRTSCPEWTLLFNSVSSVDDQFLIMFLAFWYVNVTIVRHSSSLYGWPKFAQVAPEPLGLWFECSSLERSGHYTEGGVNAGLRRKR